MDSFDLVIGIVFVALGAYLVTQRNPLAERKRRLTPTAYLWLGVVEIVVGLGLLVDAFV